METNEKKSVRVLAVDPGARRIGYALVSARPGPSEVRILELGTLRVGEGKQGDERAKERLRELINAADWVVVEEVRPRVRRRRRRGQSPQELKKSLEETQRWYQRALELARHGGEREVLIMPGFTADLTDGRFIITWKEAFTGRRVVPDEEIIRRVEAFYQIRLLPEEPAFAALDPEEREHLVRRVIDQAEALAMAAVALRDEVFAPRPPSLEEEFFFEE